MISPDGSDLDLSHFPPPTGMCYWKKSAKGTEVSRHRAGPRGVVMSEGVNASPKPPGFGSWLLSPGPFRGGVIITLLAIGLLVSTFYASSPLVPRTIAILLALIGVATSAGLVPVPAPR